MNETKEIASDELWKRAKEIYLSTLHSEEERSQIDRYISTIVSVERKDEKFIVTTSNAYAAEYLKDNYADRLKKCLELVSDGEPIDLVFASNAVTRPSMIGSKSPTSEQRERISSFISTMPLNDDYTFDEFVRGPSNSFALAAAMAVVKNPGNSRYNPLFIYGGTGLGKTHLMQAIGNELKKIDPSLAICYLTAEEYLNEYVNYMKDNNIPAFRNKYRTIDVLLLDDVQFFQKGKAIQEEFFNTFNALQQAKKQIVMTSDVAPKHLPSIESRLISRFEGGILQEIESPSYETRLAILRKKSEGMVPQIPDNALEFIADTIKSHVRAMEGALHRISIFRSMDPTTQLTNENLSHLLKDFIEKEQSMKNLTIEEIQSSVAKKFSVTIAQILSAERTQSIVTPRQIAMYISRKFTTKSLPEIAKLFDKTHATIIHGVKNIEKRMDVEMNLKQTVSEILTELGCNMTDKMD